MRTVLKANQERFERVAQKGAGRQDDLAGRIGCAKENNPPRTRYNGNGKTSYESNMQFSGTPCPLQKVPSYKRSTSQQKESNWYATNTGISKRCPRTSSNASSLAKTVARQMSEFDRVNKNESRPPVSIESSKQRSNECWTDSSEQTSNGSIGESGLMGCIDISDINNDERRYPNQEDEEAAALLEKILISDVLAEAQTNQVGLFGDEANSNEENNNMEGERMADYEAASAVENLLLAESW